MTNLLYFAIHELHYPEELALTTSLARIVLLFREHIDQNTPTEKRQIVDLWTEETIEKLVTVLKKPKKKDFDYIMLNDYRPILPTT